MTLTQTNNVEKSSCHARELSDTCQKGVTKTTKVEDDISDDHSNDHDHMEEGHLGPVSWRPTTSKSRQFSQSNRHSIIDTGQTEYHEALPSSANVQSHLTSSFADDGNAS